MWIWTTASLPARGVFYFLLYYRFCSIYALTCISTYSSHHIHPHPIHTSIHKHVYPNYTPPPVYIQNAQHCTHPSLPIHHITFRPSLCDITCPTHPTQHERLQVKSYHATATCYPRLTEPYLSVSYPVPGLGRGSPREYEGQVFSSRVIVLPSAHGL